MRSVTSEHWIDKSAEVLTELLAPIQSVKAFSLIDGSTIHIDGCSVDPRHRRCGQTLVSTNRLRRARQGQRNKRCMAGGETNPSSGTSSRAQRGPPLSQMTGRRQAGCRSLASGHQLAEPLEDHQVSRLNWIEQPIRPDKHGTDESIVCSATCVHRIPCLSRD